MEETMPFGWSWLIAFSRTALGLVKQLTNFKLVKGSTIITVAEIVQHEIAERYARRSNQVWFMPVGRFSPYDAISADKANRIECKFEANASRTGNLAIEISYRGKPSGITATQSDLWVHSWPVSWSRVECIELPTERLREVIIDMRRVTGGDGNRSVMCLLPIERAKAIATDHFVVELDWSQLQPYWKQ